MSKEIYYFSLSVMMFESLILFLLFVFRSTRLMCKMETRSTRSYFQSAAVLSSICKTPKRRLAKSSTCQLQRREEKKGKECGRLTQRIEGGERRRVGRNDIQSFPRSGMILKIKHSVSMFIVFITVTETTSQEIQCMSTFSA